MARDHTDRRDRRTTATKPPAEPHHGGGAWGSLYGGAPPRETGIGAATVRAQRKRKRVLVLSSVAFVVVLAVVGFFLAPRWWWNPRAYGDHVGAGAYVDPTPKKLRAELDRALPGLQSFVERERGLRFAGTPSVVYLPDDRFRTELRSHIAFEQRRFVGGPTYDVLGWHHDGTTFNRLDLKLSGSNAEALYGDWDGMIYLRGQQLTPLAKAQLVGLLTKSLDDQTYNLNALYGPNAEQDERSAYDALVAGDMRWTERAYVLSRPVGERCPLEAAARFAPDAACAGRVRPQAPLTDPIAAEIRFPEDAGLTFVSRLRAAGGAAAVSAAFNHPPRSSADIMSVPHYRLDLSFRAVDFPPHPGRLVDFGTLGAYTLSLALNGGPQSLTPDREVQGWRGDSFSTYRTAGQLCLRDTAVFDRPAQAARFIAQVKAAGMATSGGTAQGGVTWSHCVAG